MHKLLNRKEMNKEGECELCDDHEIGNELEVIIEHLEILSCYQDRRVNEISLIPLLNKLRKIRDGK